MGRRRDAYRPGCARRHGLAAGNGQRRRVSDRGTGTAITKQGGDSWFFITADYAFGHALERDTAAVVELTKMLDIPAAAAETSAAVLADLPVAEYTALQIKQAVVGHGKAAKEQVQEMVRRLLSLSIAPSADAADALACAICHAASWARNIGLTTVNAAPSSKRAWCSASWRSSRDTALYPGDVLGSGTVGPGASPVLGGNLLVISHDNEKQQFIAAFDKQTGKQIWRKDRDVSAKGQDSGPVMTDEEIEA